MAVVQISKIQIRRGKKTQGTGLPQLASGELAWAVDTQELFIGNGSVGEGAPAVGNTKVLTQHDNILDLLEQYQYKTGFIQTGINENFPVKRTLLSRLDEGSVNGRSFGIVGDGVQTDQTAALQNALYSLYLTVSPHEKVTLELDPGNYKISGTVFVPSNVKLSGSGKDKTVFEFVKGGINLGVAFALAGTSVTTNGVYSNIFLETVTGTGDGAIFTVAKTGTGAAYTTGNTTITVIQSGSGYVAGDVVRIPGNQLGGATPTNDLIITLSAASGNPIFNTNTVFEFINESSTRLLKNTQPTSSTNQPKNIFMEGFSVETNRNDIKIFDFRNVRDSEFNNIKCRGTWIHDDEEVSNSIALDMFATSSIVTCQRNKFNNLQVEGFTYAVSSNTDIINNHFDNCYFKTLFQGVNLGVNSIGFGPRKNSFTNSIFDTISQHGILVNKGYGNRSRGNTFINVGNNSGGNSTGEYSVIRFNVAGNSTSQDNFDREIGLAVTGFGSDYVPEVEGIALREETAAASVFLLSTIQLLRAFRLPINDATAFEINYVFKSTTYNQMRKGTMHIAVDRANSNIQLVDEYEYLGQAAGENAIFFQAGFETPDGVPALIIYYTNSNLSDENSFTYTYSALS